MTCRPQLAFAFLLALATAPLAAQTPTPAPTSGAILAETTLRGCYRLMAGEIALGRGLTEDNQVLTDAGLEVGLKNATLDALGRDSMSLISQSFIGQRVSGEDVILFAAGGRMPGCRTILLSQDAATNGDGAAAVLIAAGWGEVTASQQTTAVQRRMFLKADAAGQPWLINMFVGSLPGSQLRVLTTVNPVPPEVKLPNSN
jgi:hypothetical protein